jgi:hypothetical protein
MRLWRERDEKRQEMKENAKRDEATKDFMQANAE